MLEGVLSASCGYGVLRAQTSSEALHVVVVRALEADALAADEVASGVRDELARASALLPGDGWPRVEIEVLRADESGAGIVAQGDSPQARGLGFGITARAWLSRLPNGPPERDTGDLRAEVATAVDELAGTIDTRWEASRHSDALRAAARRLGRQLARRIERLPATTDDPPES